MRRDSSNNKTCGNFPHITITPVLSVSRIEKEFDVIMKLHISIRFGL